MFLELPCPKGFYPTLYMRHIAFRVEWIKRRCREFKWDLSLTCNAFCKDQNRR